MDYVILVAGVLLSASAEYLAAALYAMPYSVINAMADEGSSLGRRLRKALDDVEETHLGIALIDVLFIVLSTLGLVPSLLSGAMASWVAIILFVVGLIIFKTIAAALGTRYGSHVLYITGTGLWITRILARPFIILNRLLKHVINNDTDEDESRGEIAALVETAREEGALDAGEYRLLTNIMRFSSIEVSDVMTPRTVVFSMHADTPISQAVRHPEMQMFSRFPVYSGDSLDSVTGYVVTRDVLRAALADRNDLAVSKLARPVSYIPENVSLDHALEHLLQHKQHFVMVVDEYGGVEGLLSMEDVIETILGVEIMDEADHVADLRQVAKEKRDLRIALRQTDLEE